MAVLDKVRRHEQLLALLHEESIASQEELRMALRRRGIAVTQATLSRDLKELQIPCVPTQEGGYRYALPEASGMAGSADPAPEQMRSVAALEATGIDSNEIGVVVFTLRGRAQGVGVYIDSVKIPEVLATVAGDDTVLVLARSVKKTAAVRRQVARLLGLD